MRLHRNLVFATVDSLHEIFNKGKQADKVLKNTLKRDKRWGARDRGFIAETTYDIVRWKRLYAEIAEVNPPFDRDNLFRLFTVWATLRGIRLPDWKQFEGVPTRRIKGRFDELSKIRRFRESIPDWLDQLGMEELGKDRWEKELKALNEEAQVVLRVNTLKTSKKELQEALQLQEIATKDHPKLPNALILEERQNVFITKEFKDGWFEVQDASSQEVARILDPKPGMRVVDMCAGAGGKSLHLASLMENKGQIISMDIHEYKLAELKKRARRNGVHNLETRTIESSKSYKKLYGKADKVLIDAPCSGLGVLKRNPDTKWKLDSSFLKELQETQQEILQSYSKIVKPEGELLYATCSILPSENQQQIKTFLNSESGKEFTLQKEVTLFPSETGFDGFYMALLKKEKEHS